jgi:predicted sulfurtransferase
VYSSFLRAKGFNNLYTLEGGIQNYLRNQGPDHWKGSLYVFDGRMAIPGDLRGLDDQALGSTQSASQAPLKAAIPCQVCGSPDTSLPHMNCANIDCNELFVACDSCKTKNSGCCCEECTRAPRLLRSAKTEGGHWGKWGNYVNEDARQEMEALISTGRNKEGRVARRERRRKALQVRREEQLKERAELKAIMRLLQRSAEGGGGHAGEVVQ